MVATEVFLEKTVGITLYSGICASTGQKCWHALSDVLASFTCDRTITAKNQNSGFGPYVLEPPEETCYRHGLVPIDHPHRCDACVREVTMAVFDMDCGTVAEIDACTGRLEAEGWHHVVYSTFSYRPEQDRPSLRLVVFLDKPVPASRWKSWRLGFIARFSVPCDPQKCAAPSHFYYAPAHPPGVEPVFVHHSGAPFPTDSIVAKVASSSAPNPDPTMDMDFDPMPEAKVAEWRRLLEKRAARWARGGAGDKDKAEILRRLLAGEALAEHGSRNHTSTRAAALMLAAWHEGTIGGALTLFRPSLEAMRAEGSKLDEKTLTRQLASAFAKVTASRAERARLDAELEDLLAASLR